MALQKELTDIERKLWTNDAVVYKDRLIEEAILVFPETGVITKDIAVSAILNENAEGRRWAEVEFDAVRSLPVAHGVALLTYNVIARWEHEAVLEAMQDRRDRHPKIMRLRRETAEHPFGTLKLWMGAAHFLTRTLQRVRTEMSLHVLAYNLKRVMQILGISEMLKALAT